MEICATINNRLLKGQRSCNLSGMQRRSKTEKAKECVNTGRGRATEYISGGNLREDRQAKGRVRADKKQVTVANTCLCSQPNSNDVSC